MQNRNTWDTLSGRPTEGPAAQPPRAFSLNPARQQAAQQVIDNRHAIAMRHCQAKGWPCDAALLTLDQVLEIRQLPEWIEAGKSS